MDGVALTGATRMRWRRSVAYLDQHHALVHGSVRDNLLAAAPDANERELRRALAQASAGFVGDLPGGLDAEIGDDGVRLSGGQRQRIALARALLGRPQLLVLDEATSALDPASEREVADAIAALRGQTTIVLISHAPWAAELADQVIRLGATQ